MIWLGIDPGPQRCGWALLDRDPSRAPRFVDGGWSTPREVLHQLEHASRVAVEWLAPGLFSRDRYEGLVATARVEGSLDWCLQHAGFCPVKLSAGQWRADVVGRSSPSDDEIAQQIRRRVTGLPAMPKTHAAHIFDALGVAYAASCAPGQQVGLALGRGRRAG